MHKLFVAALLVLISTLTGCSQDSPSRVIQAIESFSAKEVDRSFDRLHYFILQPDLHQEAAAKAALYIQDPDPVRRFVAIYLLGNTGTEQDRQTLKSALNDEITSYRTIAAGTLMRWGAKEAIPVLIESLTDTTPLPYSRPPLPARDLAQDALMAYTGTQFGLAKATTEEAFKASQALWQQWWQDNGPNLTWNSSERRYE